MSGLTIDDLLSRLMAAVKRGAESYLEMASIVAELERRGHDLESLKLLGKAEVDNNAWLHLASCLALCDLQAAVKALTKQPPG